VEGLGVVLAPEVTSMSLMASNARRSTSPPSVLRIVPLGCGASLRGPLGPSARAVRRPGRGRRASTRPGRAGSSGRTPPRAAPSMRRRSPLSSSRGSNTGDLGLGPGDVAVCAKLISVLLRATGGRKAVGILPSAVHPLFRPLLRARGPTRCGALIASPHHRVIEVLRPWRWAR
jgi:hypothetical protein